MIGPRDGKQCVQSTAAMCLHLTFCKSLKPEHAINAAVSWQAQAISFLHLLCCITPKKLRAIVGLFPVFAVICAVTQGCEPKLPEARALLQGSCSQLA